MQLVPLVERLEQQLQSIENQVIEMLDASTIKRPPKVNYPTYYEPSLVALTRSYSWGEDNDNQKRLQLKLLRSYLSWFEQFQMLFYNSPEALQAEMIIAHADVRNLIEKNNRWNVPSTIDA